MEKNNNVIEKMPVKQGLIMEAAALVMVIAVTAMLTVLDLSIWVVWLGMCAWAAFGMPMNIKDIIQCWLSAAVGLTLAYLMTSGKCGTAGLIIGFGCVLVFIFGMVSHRFSMVCNNYTALFLTCSTAAGVILEPVQLAKSVVFGFLLFGILPWGASQLMAKKKKQPEQS